MTLGGFVLDHFYRKIEALLPLRQLNLSSVNHPWPPSFKCSAVWATWGATTSTDAETAGVCVSLRVILVLPFDFWGRWEVAVSRVLLMIAVSLASREAEGSSRTTAAGSESVFAVLSLYWETVVLWHREKWITRACVCFQRLSEANQWKDRKLPFHIWKKKSQEQVNFFWIFCYCGMLPEWQKPLYQQWQWHIRLLPNMNTASSLYIPTILRQNI